MGLREPYQTHKCRAWLSVNKSEHRENTTLSDPSSLSMGKLKSNLPTFGLGFFNSLNDADPRADLSGNCVGNLIQSVELLVGCVAVIGSKSADDSLLWGR